MDPISLYIGMGIALPILAVRFLFPIKEFEKLHASLIRKREWEKKTLAWGVESFLSADVEKFCLTKA
jgi:hypothetical protein